MTAHEDPPHIDHMGPSSGIQSLNAPPESSVLSEILNVRAWWVVGYVCDALSPQKKDTGGLRRVLGRSELNEAGSGRESEEERKTDEEKCRDKRSERNGTSELRPTGLELGSQRGSHYMRTSDSSLSLG